jgi:tRNA A37 threonylcarbamoyladenosine dehydratase
MGKHLLGIMQDAEIVNCMCFLTREYCGEHLGYRRFEIISDLIDNIYEKVQMNHQPTYLNI